MDKMAKAGFDFCDKIRYIRPLVHSRAGFMPWTILVNEVPSYRYWLSLGDGRKRTSDTFGGRGGWAGYDVDLG